MFFKRILITGIVFSALFLCLNFVLPSPANAQSVATDIGEQLRETAGAEGAALGAPTDPRLTIILLIRTLLGFTTIVLIILNLYAGITWMTAGGNEEKVTQAKTTLRNAMIGLIIVLGAYSLTIFAIAIARGGTTGGLRGVLGGLIPFLN